MAVNTYMNPEDQSSQNGAQLPQPTDVALQSQVDGSQGAVYNDPAPPQTPAPMPNRATFAPDIQPGLVIPGDPNKPMQAPGANKPTINPNSTQNNLQIAEVRDGVVIMNDGSYRSVIMFKSINFDLMSPAEREGV
jgi:hypothetical protein